MKDIVETVNRYVAAWDEPTPEATKAALEECCAPEITYVDKATPLITGIEALADLIKASHQQVPGRTFSVLTAPEYFVQHCYYSWGINIPGKGVLAGRDYIEYNDQNMITRIVGFLPV